MKIELNKEYYFEEATTFNEYLDSFLKVIKDKKIKYIFTNDALFWSENYEYADKVYYTYDTNYIVFENNTVLKFSYNFFSIIDISYMNIKNINKNDKECNNDNFILDLDVKDTKIIDYELERFNDAYITNPSEESTRPEDGDYFKEIVFHLKNNKKLCICAENAESDGYCDIWLENNTTKGIYNGNSHKI